MKEGSVAVVALPQLDRQTKKRPVLVLREMPLYRDFLVCGISSKFQRGVPGFDEVIALADPDFASSGLITPSLVRLGFLDVLPRAMIIGAIGTVSPERHRRLLDALGSYLIGQGSATG
jgi:mRNA interferase MazF